MRSIHPVLACLAVAPALVLSTGACSTGEGVERADRMASPLRAGHAEGAPPPEPPTPCSTDNDCEGCSRCYGASATARGACAQGVQGMTACMCDAECVTVGKTSCDLSLQKPLCGGTCSDQPVTRAYTCGGGDDVVRVEAFVGTTRVVPAGVLATTIVIAVEGDRP